LKEQQDFHVLKQNQIQLKRNDTLFTKCINLHGKVK